VSFVKIKIINDNTGKVYIEEFPTKRQAEIYIRNENIHFNKNYRLEDIEDIIEDDVMVNKISLV
jgi:hypothetical protein